MLMKVYSELAIFNGVYKEMTPLLLILTLHFLISCSLNQIDYAYQSFFRSSIILHTDFLDPLNQWMPLLSFPNLDLKMKLLYWLILLWWNWGQHCICYYRDHGSSLISLSLVYSLKLLRQLNFVRYSNPCQLVPIQVYWVKKLLFFELRITNIEHISTTFFYFQVDFTLWAR